MKRHLFLSLCSLFVCTISFAQTNVFKLRIESCSVAREAGVLATLTNVSNHIYTVPSFSNAIPLVIPRASILIPEMEMDNGEVADGIKQGFFYSELSEISNILFKSGESYQILIPLKEHINDLTGIASPSKIDKVKRVRLKLTKFKAFTIVDKKIHMVDTVLYSNWIDIKK